MGFDMPNFSPNYHATPLRKGCCELFRASGIRTRVANPVAICRQLFRGHSRIGPTSVLRGSVGGEKRQKEIWRFPW
jgi:hypothetical protein